MTIKIDIISGFLGAGKTTMIKKLLSEKALGDRIAIIENEFGDINIDADRLEETGIEIRPLSAGCICCTLSGDFLTAIRELIKEHNPNRIVIEPTGVGRLSEIISVVNKVKEFEDIKLDMTMTIVDTVDFEDYIDVFGGFFKDQIQYANIVVLSKSQLAHEEIVNNVIKSVRKINSHAKIVATAWDEVQAKDIIDLAKANIHYEEVDDSCHCHNNHDHHYEDDSVEQFDFITHLTMKTYSKEEIESILNSLKDFRYGEVLRAKGSFLSINKKWLDFDFVAKNYSLVEGKVKTIGQITVIGRELDKESIKDLFA